MNLLWLFIVFAIGLGSGMAIARSRSEERQNPFLDPTDSDTADNLRAEGAEVVQARIERRKDKIITQAKVAGRITNDGVEELFCISDATASRYLGQLVAENKLIKFGTTGKGVYYEPQ